MTCFNILFGIHIIYLPALLQELVYNILVLNFFLLFLFLLSLFVSTFLCISEGAQITTSCPPLEPMREYFDVII